jgi:hypothetical protein
VALGLLRQTAYQQRPQRFAYRLTQEGLKLYDHVLMIWVWEKRWGSRKGALPAKLTHRPCGHHFVPVLSCSACGEKAGMNDLQLSFKVNQTLLEAPAMPLARRAWPRTTAPTWAWVCGWTAGPC